MEAGTKHSLSGLQAPIVLLNTNIFICLQIFLFRSSYTDSLRSNNNDHPVSGVKQHQQPASVLDINKEKRTQKFLLLILISHFLCILPIHIVK